MSSHRKRAALVLGVAAAVAAFAPAAEAQFAPQAMGPLGRAEHGCLRATPDGSVVAWDTDDKKTYIGGLDGNGHPVPAQALPERLLCPVPAVDAAGTAAVAGDTGLDGRLVVARRGGDGTFKPVALGRIGAESRVDSAAVGGGQLAVGYTDGESGPGIALLRADGAVVGPKQLPAPQRESMREGPVVGLDATGRGLVLWVAARERSSLQLLGATLAPDGTLGPARMLAEDKVRANEDFAELGGPAARVAVGADGRAAAAWVIDGRTVVATGDTTAGIDLATATAAPIGGVAAVQPDGAAIAAEAAPRRSDTRIASRAAGRPFTAPRRFPGTAPEPVLAVAIDGGRAAAVFESRDAPLALQRLFVLSGAAGDLSGPPQPLLSAAATTTSRQTAAALPGGTPAVPAMLAVESGRSSGHEPTVFRHGGPSRRPRARVRLAAVQRIGSPPALRVRVRCQRACGVQVAGATPGTPRTGAEAFGVLRRLPAGRTVPVRVPLPIKDYSRGDRLRLYIGIVDAGGELRLRRRVTVGR